MSNTVSAAQASNFARGSDGPDSPLSFGCSSSGASNIPTQSRRRLNLVTFDHMLNIDLSQALQDEHAPLVGAASAAGIAAPAPEVSISTLERRSSVHPEHDGSAASTPVSASASIPTSAAASSGARLATIHSFVSPEECTRLVRLASDQFDCLEGEYEASQRDATRLLVHSPELASTLWKRLQTMLDIDATWPDRVPMGFGTDGRWKPMGLNPCFRFSRYEPGSAGFQPHRDSAFVRSCSERSVLTLLIYLTGSLPNAHDDGLLGGTTFFHPNRFEAGGLVRDEQIERVMSVQSVQGRALLFPHEVVHAGNPLSLACAPKLILRTDVVYRRTTSLPRLPPHTNWRYDPLYHMAVEFFQMAFKLELVGRVREASEFYERCNSLRVDPLMESQSIRPRGTTLRRHSQAQMLVPDLLRCIVHFLTFEELREVRSVCYEWQRAVPLSIDPLLPSVSPLQNLGFTPSTEPSGPDFSHSDLSECVPTIVSAKGIDMLMRYRAAYYIRHQVACDRVMAALAVVAFSHALLTELQAAGDVGSALSDPMPASPASSSSVSSSSVRPSTVMLRTRFVLRYCRGFGVHPACVSWCTVGELVQAVFRGQHVPITFSTLEQFNAQDEDADPPSSPSRLLHPYSCSTTLRECAHDPLWPQDLNEQEQDFLDCETHKLQFLHGLAPAFQHAGQCSGCNDYDPNPRAHSLHNCGGAEERQQQLRDSVHPAHLCCDAEELRVIDQSLLAPSVPYSLQLPPLHRDATAAARLPAGCPSPLMAVVRISQEHKQESPAGQYCFRMSYIGVPCL